MKNILILNCSTLSNNDISLWNQIHLSHRENCNFIFFTTTTSEEINFENQIKVDYDKIVFELDEHVVSSELKSIITEISECDKIWEHFDAKHSAKVSYSWYVFWLIVLNLYKPASVFIWNGYHIPERSLAKVSDALGIQKYFVERGPFAGTYAFDSEGINYGSTLVSNFEQLQIIQQQQKVEDFKRAYLAGGISNWQQPSERVKSEFFENYGIPENKLVIFFPSQVGRDSNSKVFSPLYNSVFEAYEDLLRSFSRHADNVFFLAKKHPMQEDSLQFEKRKLSFGCWVEDAHIFDCIRYADAIVSINSSAAVEAALIGKPVLLLGQSILEKNKGIFHLRSKDRLDCFVDQLIEAATENKGTIDYEFFSALLFEYLYSPLDSYAKMGVRGIDRLSVNWKTDNNGLASSPVFDLHFINGIIPRNGLSEKSSDRDIGHSRIVQSVASRILNFLRSV